MALRELYTPEEAAELNRLLDALPAAITIAGRLLQQVSVRDPTYLAAGAEVSKILARIHELMNRRHSDPDGRK